MSAVGGNYISDGAIMAWLASQQDRIYGDLKESMDVAERRADLASKLVDIKAHLEEANRNLSFGEVDKELQAFMAEYGSDPEFAELCQALAPIAERVHADWEYAVSGYEAKVEQYYEDKAVYDAAVAAADQAGLPNSSVELLKPTWPDEPIKSYAELDIDTWTNLIDGKLDTSSKNDQLTMIHIQELKATLDQGSQLASSFIAGGDKTTSAIINNIA